MPWALSWVPETQMLDTQAIIHELSTDSEVTFRRDVGSAEILPYIPGIDPFEDTRPMYTSSDVRCIQQSPITATSPSVIVRSRIPPGLVPSSSYIFGLQPTPGSTSYHTNWPYIFTLCTICYCVCCCLFLPMTTACLRDNDDMSVFSHDRWHC